MNSVRADPSAAASERSGKLNKYEHGGDELDGNGGGGKTAQQVAEYDASFPDSSFPRSYCKWIPHNIWQFMTLHY